MKILITGASSLPGYRTALEALNRGHEVIALYKEHQVPIGEGLIRKARIDIRNKGKLKDLLLAEKPEVIVHMAALGDVDLCERNKPLAWDVNVRSTITLVSLAASLQSFMVYLSTDFVFDGERGSYAEEDPPNPINYYGLTKLMGEGACMSWTKSAIVRASSIYGFGPGRMNFAKLLVGKLEKGESMKAIVDQHTSPTQATLLAVAVLEIVEKKMTNIFHFVGKRMSRYEFAMKVVDVLNLDKSLVHQTKIADMKWFAKRPRDSSLSADATRKRIKTDFYSTETAMEVLKKEYRAVGMK